MRFCFSASLLFCCTWAGAQSISLPGTIVIQNSEYETGHKIYVSDASIRAPFAKAVTSDRSGGFMLVFAGVESGEPVRLTVSKPGLELVNPADLEAVVLGRAPVLRVVMADPSKLAEARARFHNFAVERIDDVFAKALTVLNDSARSLSTRIAAVRLAGGDSIVALGDAIDRLTIQRDEALDRANDLAAELAMVDLDEASDLFRKAYELLRRGMPDSALAVLDNERLAGDHAKAVAQRASGMAMIEQANRTFMQLFRSYVLKADVLEATLDYEASLRALNELLAITAEQPDAFEAEHMVRLEQSIARIHRIAGRAAQALAQLEETVRFADAHLPLDHPEWAELHASRARVLSDLGRNAEAVEEAKKCLEIRRRIMDPKCEEMGLAYHELATASYGNGQMREALDYALKAIAIIDSVPLSDPSLKGNVRNALCYALLGSGDLPGALNAARESLANLQETKPKGDPAIGTAHASVAFILYNLGRYDEAIASMNEALANDEATFGRIHPAIALRRNALGVLRSTVGDNEGALHEYEECLAIRSHLLDPDHPDVAESEMNLGLTLSDMGRYAEADTRLRSAYLRIRKALGSDHPTTAIALGNIGLNALRTGQLDTAMACDQGTIDILQRVYPQGHPQIANAYANLAAVHDAAGRTTEAIEDSRKAFRIACNSIGPMSPQAAQFASHLGAQFWSDGRMDSSMVYYRISYQAASASLENDDPIIGRICGGLAMAMAASGIVVDSVIALAERGSRISSARNGEAHTETAHAHAASGYVLRKAGMPDPARVEYQKALDFYQTDPKAFSGDISESALQIGAIMHDQGQDATATAMLDRSMQAKPNPGAAWIQFQIAEDQGNNAVALERLTECLRWRDKWRGIAPSEKQAAIDRLKQFALDNGRRDLLQEFNIE